MHRILVSDGLDPATGRPYCRPLGGSVEFGDLAANAQVRVPPIIREAASPDPENVVPQP